MSTENKTQEKQTNDLLSGLHGLPEKETVEIGADFYSFRKGSRADAVLRTEGKLDIKANFFEFHLQKPFYVRDIYVTGTDAKKPKIKLEFFGSVDQRYSRSSSLNVEDRPDQVVFEVNNLITGFRIASDSYNPFSKPAIKELRAYGLQVEDFPDVVAHFEAVETLKADAIATVQAADKAVKLAQTKVASDAEALRKETEAARTTLSAERKKQDEALAAEKATHEEEIEELEGRVSAEKEALEVVKAESVATQKAVEKLTIDRAQLETTAKALHEDIQSKTKKHDEVQQRIAEKDAELEIKTKQAAVLKDELITLNNDRSLFANDLKGYAQQSLIQARVYIGLLVFCVISAIGFGIWMMIGAEKLFNTFLANPKEYNIWELIGSRAPFVVFAGLVFGLLYLVARILVNELLAMNRKKLRLSEITILSRDISDAAMHESDHSDHEREAVRIGVRMFFLREYLTGKLDPVSGLKQLPNQVPNVWFANARRFLPKKSSSAAPESQPEESKESDVE